jgi:hypothetical protein
MKRTYFQYIRNHKLFLIVPLFILVCAGFAFNDGFPILGWVFIFWAFVIEMIVIFDFRRWKAANEKTDKAGGVIK